MTRQETILSVFVSSPDDVKDERERLEEVIREFNKTWRAILGISMDLVRWETDAYPGIAEDPQAVINEQLPKDYDVFVGIMWGRFGTATKRAGSGTIEEFEHAKKRYDKNPKSVNIMFYFKDEPISPSKINIAQISKVIDFKKSLGKEGVLYWPFNNIDDFERLLRMHLSRKVQELNKELKTTATEPFINKTDALNVAKPDSVCDESDLGLIDFIEIGTERFSNLTEITNRIGTSTQELADKMNICTEEMNEISILPQGDNKLNAAKRLIAKASGYMDVYSSRIDTELPLFGKNLKEGIDSFIQVFKISIEFGASKDEQGQLKDSFKAVTDLKVILKDTEGEIQKFRNVVDALPRMTSVLNKSRKKVVFVLDCLLSELRNGQNLLQEAEQLLNGAQL
jgi:hypothetical protein